MNRAVPTRSCVPELTTSNVRGSVVNNLAHYQQHSRLHFIGGWRYRAEEMFREWYATLSFSYPNSHFGSLHREDRCPWMHPFRASHTRKNALANTEGGFAAARRRATPPRAFIHVDMDAFFCSVALSRPEHEHLRGLPVAAAVGIGNSEITSCNYVARACGVAAGMFVGEVRRTLCPQLRVVPFEMDRCAVYAEYTYKIMLGLIPIVNTESFEVRFGTNKSCSCSATAAQKEDCFVIDALCCGHGHEDARNEGGCESSWAVLDVVVEVISVDDTMISVTWPSEFVTACEAMQSPRSLSIVEGPAVCLSPSSLEVDLEAALYAVCVTYAALLRSCIAGDCSGISASCGIGPSYLASRLATSRAKPNGTAIVLPSGALHLPPELSFERLLGMNTCSTNNVRRLSCTSHSFWASLKLSGGDIEGAPGLVVFSNRSIPYSSWRVRDGATLQAPNRLLCFEDKSFLDNTEVCELFGVGRKVHRRLAAVYHETVSKHSQLGLRSSADGKEPPTPKPNRVQTVLSFVKAPASTSAVNSNVAAPLTIALKRSSSSTRQGLEDDLTACLIVAGGPTPIPGAVSAFVPNATKLNCAMFRVVSLAALQECVGRKNGVLLYCYCRGIDFRSLNQTGLSSEAIHRIELPAAINAAPFATRDDVLTPQEEEAIQAFRDSVLYVTKRYFAREESAAAAISTTMGYACRPQHIHDVKSIFRQLLADVTQKILLRRFAPIVGDDGQLTPNRYEAFHSIRLTFLYRHPEYPKETTKYLGLGRCVEKVFTVRCFADRDLELNPLQFRSISRATPDGNVPAFLYYSGITESVGGADPEKNATMPERSAKKGGARRGEVGPSSKRGRAVNEDLDPVGEREEDLDLDSIQEQRPMSFSAAQSNPIPPSSASAVVVISRSDACVSKLRRRSSSGLGVGQDGEALFPLCLRATNPPVPPESDEVVPLSIASLRRLRDTAGVAAGGRFDPASKLDEPLTAADAWIDAVTAALECVVRGAFVKEGEEGLRARELERGVFMLVEDVRGMSLSITGLRTTEALHQHHDSARQLPCHPIEVRPSAREKRPSDWLPRAKILSSRIGGGESNTGRCPHPDERKQSLNLPAAVVAKNAAVARVCRHQSVRHVETVDEAEDSFVEGAQESKEEFDDEVGAFEHRLALAMGVHTRSSPLPLAVFTDMRLPAFICQWAISEPKALSLLLRVFTNYLERGPALAGEATLCMTMIQAWVRMWDLAGGPPLSPEEHMRWLCRLA